MIFLVKSLHNSKKNCNFAADFRARALMRIMLTYKYRNIITQKYKWKNNKKSMMDRVFKCSRD